MIACFALMIASGDGPAVFDHVRAHWEGQQRRTAGGSSDELSTGFLPIAEKCSMDAAQPNQGSPCRSNDRRAVLSECNVHDGLLIIVAPKLRLNAGR